jgi:hypothetical protein
MINILTELPESVLVFDLNFLNLHFINRAGASLFLR